MNSKGPAKKLTIYVDETDRFHGKPVYEVLTDIFSRKNIAGATIFRGTAGYGADGDLHTAKILELATTMPLKIEVVDSEEMITKILPDVYNVVENGLVEVSDTHVVKCRPKPSELQQPRKEKVKFESKARMLRIIVSEDDLWEGEPLHEAIIKRLIMHGIAGATVCRAIAGFGPHRRYHRKKTLTSTRDMPIILTVIDTEENVKSKVLPLLDDMVGEGIAILSDVDVIKYTHSDTES